MEGMPGEKPKILEEIVAEKSKEIITRIKEYAISGNKVSGNKVSENPAKILNVMSYCVSEFLYLDREAAIRGKSYNLTSDFKNFISVAKIQSRSYLIFDFGHANEFYDGEADIESINKLFMNLKKILPSEKPAKFDKGAAKLIGKMKRFDNFLDKAEGKPIHYSVYEFTKEIKQNVPSLYHLFENKIDETILLHHIRIDGIKIVFNYAKDIGDSYANPAFSYHYKLK